MPEYSNSPAVVKSPIGNPVALFKKKQPNPGPPIQLLHTHSTKGFAAQFSLDMLAQFDPKGSREDRAIVRIPAKIGQILEDLHYHPSIDEQYSISRLGRFVQQIGSEALAEQDDIAVLVAGYRECRRAAKHPVRSFEYRPFSASKIRSFGLQKFGLDLQQKAATLARSLGLSFNAWIGLSMLSGLATAPMVNENARLDLQHELTRLSRYLSAWKDDLADAADEQTAKAPLVAGCHTRAKKEI